MSSRCITCDRDPGRMNSHVAECSHVDCPHRRTAWSERPTPAELHRGPWPSRRTRDPRSLDVAVADSEGGEID